MIATPVALNPDTQTERLVLALRERILKGEFAQGERLTELGLVSLLQARRFGSRSNGWQTRDFSIQFPPAASDSVHSA
jgi:hypothetical protein